MAAPEPGTVSLLDLPQTVVGLLLPYLHPTDLLRLRHVHSVTRDWVTSFSPNSATLSTIWQKSPENFVEINRERRSIYHLLVMRPPNPLNHCQNYYIKNYRWDLFSDPNFDRFVELSGSNIVHLHIQRYSLCRNPRELSFYNSLVNLKKLDIDTVEMDNMGLRHLISVMDYVPATFGNVLELSIGRIDYGVRPEDHLDQRRYIRNHFFPAFTSLKVLKSPKEDFNPKDVMELLRTNPECFCVPFIKIFPFLLAEGYPNNNNNDGNNNELTTLKVLDMQSIREPYLDLVEFVSLAVAAFKHGVELRNLRATFHCIPEPELEEFMQRIGPLPPDLADLPPQSVLSHTVTSILNIVPSMLLFPCPTLKEVTVTSCNWCLHDLPSNPMLPPQKFRINWPNLESLELNINCKKMGSRYFEEDEDEYESLDETDVLLKYLFMERNSRPALKVLRLSFIELMEEMPLPALTKNIGQSCKNLVKLELHAWKGGFQSYWPLWKSLTKLEDILIYKCKGLGDFGFLGPVKNKDDKPLFLNLKKLKVLVLQGMESMPGITDVTFQQVIKNLSLSHFEMTSEDPLHTVTINGIRSLLDGPFAQSIEYFPFSNWTLAGGELNRRNEDILNLHSQFRSTQMETLCDPYEHQPGLSCRNCRTLSSLAEHRSIFQRYIMESVLLKPKRRRDYDYYKEYPKEDGPTVFTFGEGVMRALHPRFRYTLSRVSLYMLGVLIVGIFVLWACLKYFSK